MKEKIWQSETLAVRNKVNSLKFKKILRFKNFKGYSDPYAKFILNNETLYKSKIIYRNLNPIWNEEFTIKLPKKSNGDDKLLATSNGKQELTKTNSATVSFEKSKLVMLVYDYDRGFLNDDFIGYANIDLNSLKENM